MSSNWQRFTQKSRLAIVKGQEEAKRLRCPYASTEHLLLGLSATGGVGVKVLEELGVSLKQVEAEMESELSSETSDTHLDIDQTVKETTPAMMQVFQLAARESNLMSLDYIGTEHLLLALLCVEDGLAAQVLKRQGVTLELARNQVRSQPGYEKPGDDDEAAESKS